MIDNGEVNIRIGEGHPSHTEKCYELFCSGLPQVPVLVVYAHREDHNFSVWVGHSFTYKCKKITIYKG